jgi:hypothetical protein
MKKWPIRCKMQEEEDINIALASKVINLRPSLKIDLA